MIDRDDLDELDLEETESDEAPQRPVPLRVQPDQIPTALRRCQRWVIWKYELNDEGDDWTKVPYVATEPHHKASSTNPATWRTFDKALAAVQDERCDGCGIVIGKQGDSCDRMKGVDLDHCIDGSGEIVGWAKDIIARLDSYTEISPSGHGLRILLFADALPPNGRKRGDIEMYESGRYLTVTGHHISGRPTEPQERHKALMTLHAEVFAPRPLPQAAANATTPASDDNTPAEFSDDELIAHALRAKNRVKFAALWKGELAGHKTPSEADSALCFLLAYWCNKDAVRIDRLFQRSGLMRPKWNELHGTQTYGQGTINKAIALTHNVFRGTSKTSHKRAASFKTQLVQLASQSGIELFHTADSHPYATVTIDERHETLSLAGRGFADWLAREYFNATKKVVSSGDLKDAVRVLIANARHTGPQRDVFIRVARVDDAIWLDLGRPQWDAIKVTRDGWRVVSQPEVKFRRSRGLLALPLPVPSAASLSKMLLSLINVSDPTLLIAWLLGALRGRKPYPIMSINGEHGSSKTSACRSLRRLIDPNTADLRLTPKEPRDLMIAALNSHVIAYDNLSVVPDWLSDALCVLSTGGGFSTRELFSDLDETLFSAERPILLNGINDVVTRPDLLDRALVVSLEPIPDENRRSELDLDATFARLHPAILAALLDAVAVALRYESTTALDRLPRMADFATWIVAASPALGWTPDEFLKAYRENQKEALDSALDGDVIVDVIKALPFGNGFWCGELKDLFALIPDHEHKPKSPRGLRSALRRRAPALRSLGFTMTFAREHVRTLTITRTDATPSLPMSEAYEPEDQIPF